MVIQKSEAFFSKDPIEEPPILEGRFFNSSDFYNHKKSGCCRKSY